jgi:hypothetical protein
MPLRKRNNVGMVQYINWPRHCGERIQVDRMLHLWKNEGSWKGQSRDIEYSCITCRMKGSFEDFATDERMRRLKWAG